MEILYFKEVDSTHTQLLKKLETEQLKLPVAIWSEFQTSGVGSRTSSWLGERGNIFLSFAILKDELPKDLPLHSASIYFSWLLLQVLRESGSKVWLKWPNDFYLDKKVGGTITTVKGNSIIVGIGINSLSSRDFQSLDIEIDNREVIERYLKKVSSGVSWKTIFSEYSREFFKSSEFKVHTDSGDYIPLKDASIYSDGSIVINGERIYNGR